MFKINSKLRTLRQRLDHTVDLVLIVLVILMFGTIVHQHNALQNQDRVQPVFEVFIGR